MSRWGRKEKRSGGKGREGGREGRRERGGGGREGKGRGGGSNRCKKVIITKYLHNYCAIHYVVDTSIQTRHNNDIQRNNETIFRDTFLSETNALSGK